MRANKRRLITIAAAAAVLAISMTATAPGVSVRKLVKKEVAKQLSGKNGPSGANGAAGAPGAAGSALGFAKVEQGGDVTESQTSSNITDANVAFSGGAGNAYCFTGLPFNVRNIQVTGHFADAATNVGRVTTTIGDTGNCPAVGAADQVTVYFTADTNIGSAGIANGFYVLFN
jgi:hypothetical protein